MSELKRLRIPVPYKGWATSFAGDDYPKGYAADLHNLLTHIPGKLVARGPINKPLLDISHTDSGGKPTSICGIWHFDDNLLIGRREGVATPRYLRPWDSPLYPGSSPAKIANPATTLPGDIQHVALGETTSTLTNINPGVSTSKQPGPRYTRLGAYVYGVSFGGASGSVLLPNNASMADTVLVKWDGTVNLAGIVPLANGPKCVVDVTDHYERLFVAAYKDPAGAVPASMNTVYYSDPGGSPTDLATDWQDVNLLYNKIIVGTDNNNESVVGFGKINGNLMIFKNRSVWILYGESPDNFTLKLLSQSYGCADNQSIVNHESGVYFMSDAGYIRFNGSTFENVSTQITSTIIAGSNRKRQGPEQSQYFTNIRAVALPNDYIFVSQWQDEGATSALFGLFNALYHIPTKAWSRFSYIGAGGGGGVSTNLNWAPNAWPFIVRTQRFQKLLSHIDLVNAEPLTVPEDTSHVPFLGLGDFNSGTAMYATAYRWRTPTIVLGDHFDEAQLKRLALSHLWGNMGGNLSQTAWGVIGTDLNGVNIPGMGNFPASGATFPVTGSFSRAGGRVQHGYVENYVELHTAPAVELLFDATVRTDGTSNPWVIEVYGVELEYQITRQRVAP